MSANERIERLLLGQERSAPGRPQPGPAAESQTSLSHRAGQRRSRTPSGRPAPEGGAARVSDISRALFERIRRRPLASLAVALGVGIVVGGALSFRAGRIALAAAARHVAHEVLKQVL